MTTATEAAQRLTTAAADGSLDEFCERRQVRLLGLFGSTVRGTLTTASDLDVAVLNSANPTLRAHALTGLGLYENESRAYAVAQMAALAAWRDTAWLSRLDLRRMTVGQDQARRERSAQ